MAVNPKNSNSSKNDSFDINELAYLDEDITPAFIEQLQMQVAKNAQKLEGSDGTLDVNMFEEVQPQSGGAEVHEVKSETEAVNNQGTINESIDSKRDIPAEPQKEDFPKETTEVINNNTGIQNEISPSDENMAKTAGTEQDIANLTQGNITEKELTKEQVFYNDALEYNDNNIKYSKYVIYIEPDNVEFIESLTVKERKNLINKLLNEQGNIILNKKKFDFVKTVINQAIIVILTIAIMIPVMYKVFNFSLEATIDNYRRSQNNFQTLYKEHGKIKQRR